MALQTTKTWDTLTQLLPSRNHDQDFWWKVTGRQLAVLLEAAGYPIERQYNTLLFHYHWAVWSFFSFFFATRNLG